MTSSSLPLLEGQDPAALLADRDVAAEERARGGRAQRHHQPRAHQLALELEPEAAGLDLAVSGRWWMRRLPRGANLKCLTALVR